MLAIIAGQGRLPGLIAGAQPAPPLICALAGFEPEGIAPDLVFRLETLGTLLQQLQARGVTEICLAGRCVARRWTLRRLTPQPGR